jgi:serine protease Do
LPRVFPALVKLSVVSLISALLLSRAKPARWLLAAMLCAWAGRAGAQFSTPILFHPAAPTPASVNRDELPAVFRKPAPTSVADLRAIEQHVTALVARVSPAVVAVEIGNSSGSGVVISAEGLVLTAGHVADHPRRTVILKFPDGKTARGKTLGADQDADTGLIQIIEPGPWPHVSVGDLDHAQRGDWTLAMGNPGGFDLTRSLVTRLGRIIRLAPDVVQTDCTIFPGDSGGPLFDMYGRVIAIHTAIANSTAENFHVPITEFYDTWAELSGAADLTAAPLPAERPVAYSGASVVDDAQGCRVSKIDQNSPAAKASLKVGDLVLKVDGRAISVAAVFQRWVAESAPGDILRLEVKRGGKVLPLTIKLQSQPKTN